MAYFTESAYKQKYVWEGYDSSNRQVTLEIWQKSTSSFAVKNIGGLVSLNLSMQGGQDSITSPIIKTSLAFTLVDAPDKSTSTEKCGDWEEFYTPDSTLYLVKLYRRWKNAGSYSLEWQGFVTPDSWQESLDYHGAITITARDNLGHLQDFNYDQEGNKDDLVTAWQLINTALQKISFPMDVDVPDYADYADAKHLYDTNGNKLLRASWVSVLKFKGRNWYDAVESTLESLGYCIRFIGGGFVVCPIRNLPLLGHGSLSTAKYTYLADLEFYGGDRSNDPAYKEIKEKVSYESENEIALDIFRNLSLGTAVQTHSGSQYDIEDNTWKSFTGRSVLNTTTAGSTDGGWLYGRGFMNGNVCEIQNTLKNEDGANAMKMGVNLSADMVSGIQRTYRTPCHSTDISLTCEFARPVELKDASSPYTVARLKDYMAKALIYIKYTDLSTGTVYYWNGAGWQTESYMMNVDIAEQIADSYSFTVKLSDINDQATLGGWLDIIFYNFYNYGDDKPDYGSFVRLTGMKVALNAKSVLKSDTVTTVNSTDYNVKVERKPEFAAMSADVPYFQAANYPAALWRYDNGILKPFGYAVYWDGYASSTAISLPAQIHKQLLCFNHISVSILEGNCGCANKTVPMSFARQFYYKGKFYLIQSGTLDVLHNRMNGAIFHEYIWYDDLWDETNNPSYSGVPVYQTNSAEGGTNGNTPSGSGGGGGGSSSKGTVTSVGLSVPTGLKTNGSPVTSAGTIAVSLETGYTIPTSADVNKGVTAYGWGNHANAGYATQTWVNAQGFIKSITSAMVTSALGYTPARSTALSSLTTRVTNAESNISDLQAAIAKIDVATDCLSAPKLKIYNGYDNNSGNFRFDPYLQATHPLIGTWDATFVLMVYSKRRGRHGKKSIKRCSTYRSGWGEARSNSHTTAPLTFTSKLLIEALQMWILQKYCCIFGRSKPSTMTMATFKSLSHATLCGFGAQYNIYSSTDFLKKTKRSRLFGIAVRYTNPEFTKYASSNPAITTREIEDDNHNKIPRYIYSEVAPFRVYCHYVDNWTLGIRLE